MDRDHGTALLAERAQAHGAVAGPRRLANRAAGRGRVSARGRCDVFRERPRQDSTSGARSARRTSGCSARTRASSSLPSAEGRESRPPVGRKGNTSSALWRLSPARRDRAARYVCELVALSPEGREAPGNRHARRAIAPEPRGNEGFGFDPVFVPNGEQQTVAELGDDWKAEHSHRAGAARALLESLAETG